MHHLLQFGNFYNIFGMGKGFNKGAGPVWRQGDQLEKYDKVMGNASLS